MPSGSKRSANLGVAPTELTCSANAIEPQNTPSGNGRRCQTTSRGEALSSITARELSEAADLATGKLARLGWSHLAARIGGRIAQFDCNFETYGALREIILRPDGKQYHVESIGRVARGLARAGVVKHQRVFMGVKPTGAKYASARGTTNKTFNWRAVTEKNPLNRRQRRLARQQQAAVLRNAGALVPAPRCATTQRESGRPQHSVPPTPAAPADLAEVISKTSAALERSWSRQAAAERPGPVPLPSAAAERPPPD